MSSTYTLTPSSSPDGHGAIPTPDLAGDVGCGAVWGENLPCHTHPKVLLISSDVPAYEMIVGTVVTGNFCRSALREALESY